MIPHECAHKAMRLLFLSGLSISVCAVSTDQWPTDPADELSSSQKFSLGEICRLPSPRFPPRAAGGPEVDRIREGLPSIHPGSSDPLARHLFEA
jgi:hypothetical protein